jgi:hypothetical protein
MAMTSQNWKDNLAIRKTRENGRGLQLWRGLALASTNAND